MISGRSGVHQGENSAPVTMSKMRICLSSWPVMSSGIVGCETILFACAEIESSSPVPQHTSTV